MITPEAQRKGAEVLKRRADARAEVIMQMVRNGDSNADFAYVFNVNPSSVRTMISRAKRRVGGRDRRRKQ